VFFAEAAIPGATNVGKVKVEISRQNAHLGEVKAKIAAKAKQMGASAVQNFRYGQRAHKWWEQAFTFKWDSESWYGEGEACSPPPPTPPST
jgi:hypothetical protein